MQVIEIQLCEIAMIYFEQFSQDIFIYQTSKRYSDIMGNTHETSAEYQRMTMNNPILQVEGAVTVQPYAEPIKGFEDYFLNLTPEMNARNPWFGEYWEDFFQCRLPNR